MQEESISDERIFNKLYGAMLVKYATTTIEGLTALIPATDALPRRVDALPGQEVYNK